MYNQLTALFVTLAAFTILLCLYVVISYLRNKHYRKPPAGLMLSKTSSDLVFSILFFIMLITVQRDDTLDNTQTPECVVYAAIFLLTFLTAQNYFTAMCWVI